MPAPVPTPQSDQSKIPSIVGTVLTIFAPPHQPEPELEVSNDTVTSGKAQQNALKAQEKWQHAPAAAFPRISPNPENFPSFPSLLICPTLEI